LRLFMWSNPEQWFAMPKHVKFEEYFVLNLAIKI
jgi:hypothetical protein